MTGLISEQRQERLRGIIDEYTSDAETRIPGLVYLSAETVFWLASFTKLATSVACMQLVEKGLIRLDDADQLEAISPELRDVKVLKRDDDGNFTLGDKKRRITLRMLLNHTAGFGYAFEDERLALYGQPIGLDDFSGERDDVINRPLVNQPGEKFQYGTSMDWVGIIIERVSGLSLEDYFQENVFGPLGMQSVSFHPSEKAKSNLAYMHQRLPGGKLIQADHLYRKPLIAGPANEEGRGVFCAGGHGCFGQPAEYRKLISLLLNNGTDSKTGAQLLKPETVEEMFKDQIPDKPRFCNEYVPVAKPLLANPTPLQPVPDNLTEGWGLSFSLSHQPTAWGRAAGSASWEGLANLYWFADRQTGLGGLIASQILPYGDSYVVECFERVEAEIYKAIRENE
ncbi:hypothetical protein VTK73DRAFT_3583 [Phialemonium thermophilum]|uniref:Beta-lactamase-related domain-containing protein n=1 Tax=Phialemonium thermophilum TaxID=223376 RepID=A0ABR3VH98_9PEZI